tara:strand:- start:438 stop:710 length:273 start_codon:yes stop_codon:yes gene_type:complete
MVCGIVILASVVMSGVNMPAWSLQMLGAIEMDWDEPIKKKPILQQPDLDVLSIEALNDYIEELRSEIGRAEEKIAAKQSARSGAEAFFKS